MAERMVLARRYRLDRLIGAGSFSEVWRALDLATGEVVALKTVRRLVSGLPANEADIADLVREAEILRRLNHPNIVRVRETGMDAGQPFVVMDYLDGPSLRSLITEHGPLDEAFATNIARHVAGALGAAHANGIVHNDVKPENIIIADGEPYLVDFGVARDLRTTLLPGQASEIAGTLAYISPEVLEGEQPGLGADLYALAVTLYEAIAGRTPFAGTTALRSAAGLPREPLPLADTAPNATLAVNAFLERALSPVPARRFPTAAAFRDSLPGVMQPTVRFERPGVPGSYGQAPPGKIAALLPRLVAGMGVAALLFAGVVFVAIGGIVPDDAPATPDEAVASMPTATPTPPPTVSAEPTTPPVPAAEIPHAPDRVQEPEQRGRADQFFSTLGTGASYARDGVGYVFGELGNRAGGLFNRFSD